MCHLFAFNWRVEVKLFFSKNDDCEQKTTGNYSITEDELVRRALDAHSYLPNLRSVRFCEKYPVLDDHAVGHESSVHVSTRRYYWLLLTVSWHLLKFRFWNATVALRSSLDLQVYLWWRLVGARQTIKIYDNRSMFLVTVMVSVLNLKATCF